MKVNKIAVVVSHPIQHFCPQYGSWSKLDAVDIKVFFASRHGLDPYEDKNFARIVQWESLSLDFPHEFLPGAALRKLTRRIDSGDLDAALTTFSPDVVVAYGYTQPLQRRAIRWTKNAGRKLLMIADSELRSRRNGLKLLAKKLLLPRIFRKVDAFLTVGDANEQYYRSYGVHDLRLIRCSFPIDTETFDAMIDRREAIRHELRGKHGIPLDHDILLIVGKLVRWKRQEDIIQLSNNIQEAGRNVTVIIAGTGPDEKYLREKASKIGPGGVIFAGFVPPTLLIDYYLAADIYVHCSEVEPHSLAISEAIYSALPVVLSSSCGSYGPSDDVRQGLNGFVYQCGNSQGLHSAIFSILENPSLRKSMASQSRSIALANQGLAHGQALCQALSVINLKDEN